MHTSIRASALGALALTIATGAFAGTIHVAANGVDAAGCGSFAAPCRTIGRGLESARVNDTVLVRPGVYGDVDRNGTLGGVGEEIPTALGTLRIAKPVKLLSTSGAATTVIIGSADLSATFEIASNGVTIGGPGEGFTIVGGRDHGVVTDNVTGMRIAGNVVTGAPFAGLFVSSSGVVEISDNDVHGNLQAGIIAMSLLDSARVLVRRNKVHSNGSGIVSSTFGPHEISANEISNNAFDGISVAFAPSLVFRNVVVGNGRGISSGTWSPDRPPSAGPTIARNTIIGNREVGLLVSAGPVAVKLRENNVYGNGIDPGYFANCGLANFTGMALIATNTYWGAATGPGADPADATCGNDPVSTIPFATRPN
ncbi:MAG: right-handed parallel beta-helix repeat-containing protein [Steroidobacteraceae bacterium]|nr:right-handed parallel beta-helix repeat-containing protein [Steroidobacteraceae bacterium]